MALDLSNAVERFIGSFERHDEREFLPAALEVIETPASPVSRVVGGLIAAFFLCAVAWAFIGRVDINATAQGRIVPAGNVKVVQPVDLGSVKAIHVQDGQTVRQGQLLIELDPTEAGADRDRLSRDLMQARLDVARLQGLKAAFSGAAPRFVAPAGASADRVAEAQAAMRAQAAEQAAQTSDLSQQIVQKTAEIEGQAAEADKVKTALPMLEEKDRINKVLTSRGYGTQLAALDAAQAVSDARHDLDIAHRRSEQAVAARAALERQRDEAVSKYQADVLSDLRKAEEQQNELDQDLIKAQSKSSETELRAPSDGVVQQLAVHSLHGVVLPGQHLMTIVPDTRNLVVEAKLDNKDVGFVFPGQPVKLKIETFNFTRYGIIDGKVISISRDVEDQDPRSAAQDNAPPSADASLTPRLTSQSYVARIAPARTTMMVERQERALQPGMNVTAEIRTGRRTIADYLLSPIARKTQESLHER